MADGLLQDEAGIAGEPASVGTVDVADETGDLALLGTPGEGDEGVDIRIEIHIGFLDPRKAVYERGVEHTAVAERLFQLGGGYGHILHCAENVRKLETDKFYVLVPDHP